MMCIFLHVYNDGKVFCNAPANEALESLMERCIDECKAFGLKEEPYVRVWFVSQVMTRIYDGDYAVLDDLYHIETLRVKNARKSQPVRNLPRRTS